MTVCQVPLSRPTCIGAIEMGSGRRFCRAGSTLRGTKPLLQHHAARKCCSRIQAWAYQTLRCVLSANSVPSLLYLEQQSTSVFEPLGKTSLI